MHTLRMWGHPIASADRWQRLCMHTADMPASLQAHMTITSGRPERRVQHLK